MGKIGTRISPRPPTSGQQIKTAFNNYNSNNFAGKVGFDFTH